MTFKITKTRALSLMTTARAQTWRSHDPDTQVGCVIADSKGNIITVGVNQLPEGVHVLPSRLERPQKYMWIEHAERNAIYEIADACIVPPYNGILVLSSQLSGPPCCDCARAIIQCGIKTVIVAKNNPKDYVDRWRESFEVSLQMFREAGVDFYSLDDL